MYKIAITGVENSHANSLLNFIKNGVYPDIEVAGIYSYDTAAAQKLADTFNVPIMESYDSLVGKIDGLVITARHGSNHLKYAKPYMESGIPMFIDKPITSSIPDATELCTLLEKYNIPVSGGSILKHPKVLQDIKNSINDDFYSAALYFPIELESMYDGFYFYSQHLVEAVLTAFGRDIKKVFASLNGNTVTVIFRYDSFDITGIYGNNISKYHATVYTKTGAACYDINLSSDDFKKEWDEFHTVLTTKKTVVNYKDFIQPVYILNAIERSYTNGTWEGIK